MYKYSAFLVPVVMMLFLSSSTQHQQNYTPVPADIGRWTGNLTLEEKYEGPNGTGERHIVVSFHDALPTLYRDTQTTYLYFTDDKGNGSVTYHAEFIINGKKMAVTDCQGSGKSELHSVVVDETENTYSIDAISPACNGTRFSLIDSKDTSTYGPEFTNIIVSDQQLIDKNLLAGTKTEVIDLGGDLGTLTRTIHWHLERSIFIDVELIVTPEDYDNWLPEPGKNELTEGSVMNISLKLQAKGGGPTDKKVKTFELHLSGTSNEPGITINFPNVPGDPKPDLRFMVQPNAEIGEKFQSLKINCPGGCQSAMAKIGSYDGGGWTTLTVEAILKDDNTRIQGKLLIPTGETDIRIPKRKQDSKIGEAWIKKYKSPFPEEMNDIETSDGNSNNGDGFTAYEEYRGIIAEGKFKRLDPEKKELGILATKRDFALFSEGINLLKNASDLEIVRFDISRREVAPDVQINFNNKSAHIFDQFAIFLLDGGLGGDAVGEMYSKSDDPDIPANTIMVVIDWNFIQRVHQNRIAETRPDLLKFTVKEYLAQTVAHELGHAINIWHHGDDIRFDAYNASQKKYVPFEVNTLSDAIRIFDRNGALITTRPKSLLHVGGKFGTVESGSLSCMINYYPYYYWGYTVGADGARIYNEVPLLPLGTILCRSNKGTGINAAQLYFGNAAGGKGDCLGQIKLKK
jgi:hypothetical protein